MPLTGLQRRVLRTLRPFRTEHSYVAGGAALNHDWPRLSDDTDIFSDQRGKLPKGMEPELQALRDDGFRIEITTEDEWMVEAILRMYGTETKVQWLDEPGTSRRFFPAIEDDEFGFRLHQADIAVNKILCAASRNQAPRDAVDLANIVDRYCPLGPLVWAAAGKDPDLTPPRVIRDIRGNAFGYSNDEIVSVRAEGAASMTRDELRRTLGPALEQASDYCDEIAPEDYVGFLMTDVEEIPSEADADAIANETAIARPIQDFGISMSIVE